MQNLFGNEQATTPKLTAFWVRYGAKEAVSKEELAELQTVNWRSYKTGNYVNLQRVKARFLNWNPETNVLKLEIL